MRFAVPALPSPGTSFLPVCSSRRAHLTVPGWGVVAMLAVALIAAVMIAPESAVPVQTIEAPGFAANSSRIKMPFPAGQQWKVLQGYNTSPAQGGSHWNCDSNTLKDAPSQTEACRAGWQYRYSLDLFRSDGNTVGQTVLSPVNGTIRWIDTSTGGMSINLGDGYAVAYFHTRIAAGLAAGQAVRVGQVLGTVAPAGEANAGSTPHIHLTVWQTTDGGNWSRTAIPFTGVNSVDGYTFPDLGASSRNQHAGVAVTSTNTAISGPQPGVPATPVQASPSSGTTAKSASVPFAWRAVPGATEYQVVIDTTGLSPWVTGTSWTSSPLAKGTHGWQVRARDASGTSALSKTWTVTTPAPTAGSTASVTLSSPNGQVGSTVTVSGRGFAVGESVSLRWDTAGAAPFATIRADAAGSFSTQVTIPDATAGAHKILATANGRSSPPSATFTVRPSLGRVPTQGAPWDRITVTVRGFGQLESVQLNWNTATGPVLGTVRTNAAGTGVIVIKVPNDSPGWHDYTGYGATSKIRAYGAIEVLSSITVDPQTSPTGSKVRVVGRGFAPGSPARITFNGSITVCTGTIASNGTLDCSFTVPKAAAGQYPLSITAGGMTKSANLTVTGPPAVSVTPPKSAVGTLVSVSVGGFGANESVTLTWDTGLKWATLRANAAGAASANLTIPELPAGAHTLTGTGATSRKAATLRYEVPLAPAAGTTSKVATGVYSVFATREGLVGGTTSSGHVIVEDDLFVSLPACTTTNCPGGAYWGQQTNCGSNCYVKVVNPATNVCRVEPIYDTGPWFRVDDWWNTTQNRYLNNLSSNPNTLAQGYVGAVAARDGLDVGYGRSPQGLGYDDTGTTAGRPKRVPANDSAIDLADGTWRRLGLSGPVGANVRVEMLWQTGANASGEANRCGHPLNEKPGDTVTFPPATPNPAFSGEPLVATGSAGSANGVTSLYARDGDFSTWWRTYTGNSQSGQFVVDYGAVRRLSGVRWSFAMSGFADQMLVETSTDRATWTRVGTYGTSTAGGWYGIGLNRSGRFARFTFANPNGDPRLGYVSEVQLWGNPVEQFPSGQANPAFSGSNLTPTGSSGSSNGATSLYARDNNVNTWWRTYDSNAGQFVIDYGEVQQLTGVRWRFSQTGSADQFTVETSRDRATWTSAGTYGNGSANTWYGIHLGRTGRYVRFTFLNPNGDARLGYVAEVQTWGRDVETYPPGNANPAFSGSKLTPTGSSGSANGATSLYARDGNTGTWWRTFDSNTGQFVVDYGTSVPLRGVRWRFSQPGSADQFLIETSADRSTWRAAGTFGNAPDTGWRGIDLGRDGRYVRFTFANPNGDARLGYVAEIELWGLAEQVPIEGSNPQFSGAPLPIRSSSASSGTNSPAYAHDGVFSTSWYSTTANPGSITLTLDLGSSRQLSGIRWTYRISGGADRMRLQISPNGSTWTQLVTTSNRVPYTWEGWQTNASARYVRFIFENPNSRPVLGYLSEAEVWGPASANRTALRAAPQASPQASPIADTGTPVVITTPAVDAGTPVASRDTTATPVATDPVVTPEPTQPAVQASPVADPGPTVEPTAGPTTEPTAAPTEEQAEASPEPTVIPTAEPTAEPTVVPTAVPTEAVRTVGYVSGTDGDGANCRTGPSADDEVIALVAEGTGLPLVGEPVDDWQQVECAGSTGWIFAEYISAKAPIETPLPTEPPQETPVQDEEGEEPIGTEPPANDAGSDEAATDSVDDEPTPTSPPTLEAGPTPAPTPTPEPTVAPTPTPVPAPEPVLVSRQVVIMANGDTSVSAVAPDSPQSPDAVSSLPIGGKDEAWAVVTFEVDGIATGTVVNATLVVQGTGDTAGPGGEVLALPGVSFDESSTTWNGAANAGGYSIGYVDWISPGSETSIDVSGVVTEDGTVSFILVGEPESIAAITSTESGAPAYLVIDIEEWVVPEE